VIPTVWLLGDPPEHVFDHLAESLRSVGAQTTLLSGDRVRDWLRAVVADEPVSVAPNLLVLDAAVALDDDSRVLRTLSDHAPWRYLPRVVVGARHDAAACGAAYSLGAANWVVLPPTGPERERACAIFAEYWGRCSLLPRVQQFTLG
jgi:hypothetical protein